MADGVQPESQSNSDLVNAIRAHRTGIKNKLPQAENILRKSGKTKDAPGFNREAINIAGGLHRANLESQKDSLTGLNNREGWDNKLDDEFKRAAREGTTVMLILLDANNLKAKNDNEGYEAGDRYLKSIGETLSESTRAVVDTVARWGGDEFGVILHNTTVEGAKAWWLRTQKMFSDRGISIGAGGAFVDPQRLRNTNGHPKTKEEIDAIKAEVRQQANDALHEAKPLSKEKNNCVLITSDQLTA